MGTLVYQSKCKMHTEASICKAKCGAMKSFSNIVNHHGKYMQSKTIAFLKRRLSFSVRDDKKQFQKISLLLLVRVVHKMKLFRRKGNSKRRAHLMYLKIRVASIEKCVWYKYCGPFLIFFQMNFFVPLVLISYDTFHRNNIQNNNKNLRSDFCVQRV